MSRIRGPHQGSSGLHANLKVQRGESQAVLILRVDVADGSIGLLQLRLAELDNRTQTKVVTSLGQMQSQIRFFRKFGGYSYALEGRVRRQPGCANVAHDPIAQVSRILRRSFGAVICL